MSAGAPEATGDDSRGPGPATGGGLVLRLGLLLRALLALAGVAGVVLLMLATRAAVIRIHIATGGAGTPGIDPSLTGADRHGPALVIIGVFAAIMLAGALRDARPPAFALAACGALVLAIAIVADARHINDTGLVGDLYSGATADAGTGFYLETLGGALLLMSGGGLVVLGGARRAPGGHAAPRPPGVPPARSGAGRDWFTDG